jgi:membrane protease subunit (stomatin/prohibitin family)
MPLFGRNPNESAYVGGKKHWTDVIKNTGAADLLIWRQPEEDFNTNSTLVVMPGEEAIFIKGGVIEQTFDNGTYKLSTENYPFISRLRNAFSGGISTFNCVVYFVKKTVSIQINWGTKAPMMVWDEMIAQSVNITAFGSYNIKIKSPEVFLTTLIGSSTAAYSPEELEDYFDGRMQEHIVSCIHETLENKGTMIFRVISKLKDFSVVITPQLEEIFIKYGIELENFSIMSLKPEEEIRLAYNNLMRNTQWSIAEKQAEAMGDRDRMDILGDDRWKLQQSKDILRDLANNPGAGGVAAAGAGLGMGIGAGSVFGGMAQNMFTPMQQQTQQPVAPQPSGRFTQKSAEAPSTQNNDADPVTSLKQLKDLLDQGLITQEIYDTKQADILSRM